MFAVLVSSAVPDHVRGYLGRFLVEVSAGVFVGVVSPRVTEGLWRRAVDGAQSGGAILVTSDSALEAGYALRVSGVVGRSLVDFDGLTLVSSLVNPQVS